MRWLQPLSGVSSIQTPPSRREECPSLNPHSLQPTQRMGGGCGHKPPPENGGHPRYRHRQVKKKKKQNIMNKISGSHANSSQQNGTMDFSSMKMNLNNFGELVISCHYEVKISHLLNE